MTARLLRLGLTALPMVWSDDAQKADLKRKYARKVRFTAQTDRIRLDCAGYRHFSKILM